MFHLIKFLISAIIFGVLAILVLGYFGYEINTAYLTQSKEACEQKLKECGKDLVRQGTDNAHCDLDCANSNILIKKK
jgi:hypothetical protein